MEQDADYKHLVSAINELEIRINILCGDELEQSRDRAKKEIDVQFDNFKRALEAKREALHYDVDVKYQSLKNSQGTQHHSTKAVVVEAKKSLSAGSLVYGQHPTLAAAVWKKALPGTSGTISTIDVTFSVPPRLMDSFGTVVVTTIPPSQYSSILQSTQNKHESDIIAANLYSFDQRLKILLIGDSKVGKSSMLQQYVDSSFTVDTRPTIGADFVSLLREQGDE